MSCEPAHRWGRAPVSVTTLVPTESEWDAEQTARGPGPGHSPSESQNSLHTTVPPFRARAKRPSGHYRPGPIRRSRPASPRRARAVTSGRPCAPAAGRSGGRLGSGPGKTREIVRYSCPVPRAPKATIRLRSNAKIQQPLWARAEALIMVSTRGLRLRPHRRCADSDRFGSTQIDSNRLGSTPRESVSVRRGALPYSASSRPVGLAPPATGPPGLRPAWRR